MAVLTVLVGAGASYDCADDTSDHSGEWRPPLVNELFQNRPRSFAHVLKKYPKAEQLSGEIRAVVNNTDEKWRKTLEEVLREASTDENPYVRKLYREVPLYLQEVIGEVGQHYIISGSNKFAPLLTAIARSIDRRFTQVLFLTVNYDLFLDRELARLYDHRFAAMADYTSHPKWGLVKLHGSVDWGRPMFGISSDNLPELLTRLTSIREEPHELVGAIQVLPNHQRRVLDGKFMYPALAVPLEGKSGFVCPDAHVDYARGLLAGSEHFMILGCRVADDDVLELLSTAKRVASLKVVGRDRSDAKSTIEHIDGHCPAFRPFTATYEAAHDTGFSHFVSSRSLQAFLAG